MRSRVTAIIVTYNSAHIIEKCLNNLVGTEFLEIIIVDNCSTDGSADVARAMSPNILVIENRENVGFSQAVNLAASRASTDYFLLLNPDAFIDKVSLHHLVEIMDADVQIGVLAPILVDSQHKFATLNGGHQPTLWRMLMHATGIARMSRFAPVFEGHYLYAENLREGRQDLGWVTGGCLLTRRSLWIELGGLSERWFMYAEDIEYCFRVKKSGYDIVLDSQTSAIHEIGQSSKNIDGQVGVAWLQNLYDLYSWRLSSGSMNNRLWRIVVAGGYLARSCAFEIFAISKNNQFRVASKVRAKTFRAYAKALRTKSLDGYNETAKR